MVSKNRVFAAIKFSSKVLFFCPGIRNISVPGAGVIGGATVVVVNVTGPE